eukprot:2834618-Rhodomonas_salina.1
MVFTTQPTHHDPPLALDAPDHPTPPLHLTAGRSTSRSLACVTSSTRRSAAKGPARTIFTLCRTCSTSSASATILGTSAGRSAEMITPTCRSGTW